MKRIRRLSGMSRSLAVTVAIQLLNVGTGIVLARFLGPAGRGQLASIILWPALILTIGSVGLLEATTYFTAHRDTPKVAPTALLVALLQSAVLTGIAFVALPVLIANTAPSYVWWARVYLLWMPLSHMITVSVSVLLGRGRITEANVIRVLVIVASAVGLGALAASGHLSVIAALIVYLVAHVVTAAFAARALWIGGVRPSRPDTRIALDLLAYGLRSHLGTISGSVNERADQAIIALFLSAPQLGLYTIAVSISSLAVFAGATFSMLALPEVAAASRSSVEAAAAVAARYSRAAFTLSILITAAAMMAAPTFIAVVFGRAFEASLPAAEILFAAALVLSANRVLGAVLRGLGRPLSTGVSESVGALATIVLLALLVPRLGIVGAALASLGAYFVTWLLMVVWLARFGVPASSLYRASWRDLISGLRAG